MPPEEKENNQESATKKVLKLLLKIVVTILCFWYISTKINWSETVTALGKARFFPLVVALVLFILSKIVSAFRLNIYFRNAGIQLSETKNLKLYWLGMFYNLFLPGAISGDAYKVILLKRRYQVSYKNASAAVLLDRFSGVLALGVVMSIYGVIVLEHTYWKLIFASGAALAIGGFYLGIRFLFPDFLSSFFTVLFWGLGVQILQVICIYFILSGLHLPPDHQWVFIFLASAVISILPVSLGGGLGTREVVFAEGAGLFQLDPQTGVTISLLFYLITLVGSLWGAYYSVKDPLEKS